MLSTLAIDQASYCNHLVNGRWKLSKLQEDVLVVVCKKTHVRACKKKSNAVKNFEKIPQLRVGINGVVTKRVKFSLSDTSLNEEVIFDEKYHDARKNDEMKDCEGLE